MEQKIEELQRKLQSLEKEKNEELQQKLQSLEKEKNEEFKTLKQKYAKMKQEYNQLREKQSLSNSTEQNEHSTEFWDDIEVKVMKDPDYVKSLIRNKTINQNDVNQRGQTLLMIAAGFGSYEIVQFCLNGGADTNHKSNYGSTALDRCRQNGYYHIEQLLLFHEMNVNAGNKVKHTSDIINKQKGINANILQELSEIGEQTRDLFCKSMVELMINIINKKLAFSDTLLNLSWDIVCQNNKSNPLSSALWEILCSTCTNIINNGSKRDWYWFKTFVLPSTIWYKTVNIDNKMDEKEEKYEEKHEDKETKQESNYLYFKLLQWVDGESKSQINKLEKNLNVIINKNKNNWNELINWDIQKDQYDVVRQDSIPNGIVCQYSADNLIEKSNANFDAKSFYDHYQYLSELILLAQIVDDDFQQSVQKIFNINKQTKIGIISTHMSDEKNELNDNNYIGYHAGPVKLLERARAKAENDYADQLYPCSACVLDLNRCSLLFENIHTLLAALKLFVNKINYFQSGSIIGIARAKNGFKEYIKQAQYADVKLNVLIKGKTNNLIGEVQFLLRTMKDYKDKAHNLYAIEREKEYIETQVTQILPMLLDEDKSLFIAGNMGDVKGLCRLMTINNFKAKDVMKKNKSNQTILHRICSLGHTKALLYVQSILKTDTFIEYIFSPNNKDIKPIEYSIMYSNMSIVKKLFTMKEIQTKYNNNDNELFRLCYWLFARCKNEEIIDYVLAILNVSNKRMIQIITTYKYPKSSETFGSGKRVYHRYSIIAMVMFENTLKSLQKLKSIIGEKVFIEAIFIKDGWGDNGLQNAVEKNKLDIMKFIMRINEIKEKCIADKDILFGIIKSVNTKYNESMAMFIVNALELNEIKLKQLQSYKQIDVAKILKLCK